MGVDITASSVSITLDPEYGYVILSAILSQIVLLFAGGFVGAARKKYGVDYPTMYACEHKGDEKEKKMAHAFNCVQRGHQNILETYPQFLVVLFVSGLDKALYSAIAGVIYCVGKMLYCYGYSIAPNYRLMGSVSFVGYLYLVFQTVSLGLRMAGLI